MEFENIGLPSLEQMAKSNKDLYIGGLSKRRMGRVTGSQLHQIGFREVKAKGNRKKDILEWILEQRGGEDLLIAAANQFGVESVSKLTLDALKAVMQKMKGEVVLTQGAETYLSQLLHEIITGEMHSFGGSAPTDWGIEYEAESLEIFKKKLLEQNPNLIFKEQEFFVWEENHLLGSTPDIAIYDPEFSLEKPIAIGENKCPFKGANHINTLRKTEFDSKYKDQLCCELLCSGAQMFYYISYDPRIEGKFEDFKHVVLPYQLSDVSENIEKIKEELSVFEHFYTIEAKKLGIDLKKHLI
jgi:hypothetical protein